MKFNLIAADDVAIGPTIERANNTILARVKQTVTAMRQWQSERVMRAEMAQLDAHILRDIGIDEDEVARVRSRDQFSPRAWRN